MHSPGPRTRRRGWSIAADLGVDLGTCNTRVHVRNVGIVVDEPSVVALRARRGDLVAAGSRALDMVGRAPEQLEIVRPVREGVVVDMTSAEVMLRHFLRAARPRWLPNRPRMVLCVPLGTTDIEQRAVHEVAMRAGARSVEVIEEPVAAAIGAHLPIHEPIGNMVVDLGGGTSEAAVLSLGGIVTHASIRTGGDDIDRAIVDHLRRTRSLVVGPRTAEQLKLRGADVSTLPGWTPVEVRGRDTTTGLPSSTLISPDEVGEAISPVVAPITAAITQTLDRTPPELVADVADRGIVLTGAASRLRGLAELVAERTGIPVHVADHPEACVARGAARYLDEIGLTDVA